MTLTFLDEMGAVMPWTDLMALVAPRYPKGEQGRKPIRLKAHIGVDSEEGIMHSLCATAASVSDVHVLPDLLHGECKVWGDGGYQGQTKKIGEAAPDAQDMTCRRVKNSKGEVNEEEKRKNRTKSRVRAKVEWPFRIIKRIFGLVKVRNRGLKKNHEWLYAAFASANIYQHRKRLARIGQSMSLART